MLNKEPFFESLPADLPLKHKIYACNKAIDEQVVRIESLEKDLFTLKAKADLFDGLLTALESYHDQLTAIDAAMGLETNGRSSVDYLLSKAKELSK